MLETQDNFDVLSEHFVSPDLFGGVGDANSLLTSVYLEQLAYIVWVVSSFMLVEENVADKSVIGLAKESAIDDFIPRFHDLAFLHFEWFGQVGHLAKVQIWQCIKSWRFHVIS